MENILSNRNLNNDELFLILTKLDFSHLVKIYAINRQTKKLFNSDRIWDYFLTKDFVKDLNDFSISVSSISVFSESDILKEINLKDRYFLLHKLQILKTELKFPYNLYDLFYTKEILLCDLSDKINNFPKEIGLLTNLQELDLSGNLIQTIPKEIGLLTNLEDLDLYDNKIEIIPKEICNLINLKYLSLGKNNITYIPDEIEKLNCLKCFDIQNNKITNIPSSLFNVNELNIKYNKIEFIPNILFMGKHLYLSNNLIENLPIQLCNSLELKFLHLDCNKIKTLPYEFCKLVNLLELDISENEISTLPTCLSSLTKLEDLYLDSKVIIPTNISALHHLTIYKE